MISGSLVTASMVMAGIGAYYLLARRFERQGALYVRVGVERGRRVRAAVGFPTGAFHGENVARFQPVKMAAMEGLFETQEGAPLAIIGMPDVERRELTDPVYVPRLLSYLAYGDFRARVTGLDDVPQDLQPPVEIVYYAYHVMVGLGTIFIAILGSAALLLWRGRLLKLRPALWALMLAMPFPYIANHAGWVVGEVGRQPWVVYGLLRTAAAGSTNVSAGMTYFTLAGFMGLYALVGLLYLFLFLRIVDAGPGAGERAMINDAWFVVLAAMLTGYAVLDGFDLGAGILHLWLGRTADERARVIDAIGPVWNGNEVWLIAAGGAMVAAFPRLYAASFSGFYLALMLVLWLLLLRGIAIEFRHQVDSELWREAWDVVFAGSSTLLALLFGVAVGNVLRGVPLDAEGQFRGSFALMLNPFAVLAGLVSVAVLAVHGAAWIALKTDGALQARARRAAQPRVVGRCPAAGRLRRGELRRPARLHRQLRALAGAGRAPARGGREPRRDAAPALPRGRPGLVPGELRHDRVPAGVGSGGPVPDPAPGAAGQRPPRPRRVQRGLAGGQPADRAGRLPLRDGDRGRVHRHRVPGVARQGRDPRLRPLTGGPPGARATARVDLRR